MSSNKTSSEFENFLFVILGVVAVVAFVLWTISSVWLTIWFYIVPSIVLSIVVGTILRIATAVWFEEGFTEKSSKFYLKYNYKALAVVYPLLIIAVLVIFEMDSTQQRIFTKQRGQEDQVSVVIEWPRINKFYNETRRAWYGSSWFESLREKKDEFQVYDRSTLGSMAWFALFLGGPAFFFFLSWTDEEDEAQVINEKIQEKVSREQKRLNELIKEQNQIIANRTKDIEEKLRQAQAERLAVQKENLVLKAKLEYASLPATLEGVSGHGVLDKDIL